jgi:hypothetical protein
VKRGAVVPAFLDPGTWSASFGLSLRDLCLHDAVTSQRIVRAGGKELRRLTGSGGIVAARNQVALSFLDNTDGEWLWFVDSDMGFAPDTVDRLVAAADPVSRRVVGALCFAQKRAGSGDLHAERYVITPTIYEFVELDDEVGFRPIEHYQRDAVQKVAATGCACILIHRGVLHNIREKYGDVWFDPTTHPTGNKGKPRTFSEDLSFCIRAAAVGEDLYVDSSVKTSHEKGGIFLDEHAYDRDRALARLEAEMTEAAHV